jgi:putative transposase
VVDQLLARRDPATVFESGGLADELKKRLAERMLNGEIDHHLGAEIEEDAGNHRNGDSNKTVSNRYVQAGAGDPAGSPWAL